jgi:hypothetical protein
MVVAAEAASLAPTHAAGLPVRPTSMLPWWAYRQFVTEHELREWILAALRPTRSSGLGRKRPRCGRARSSPDKAANPADARIQAIRDGGRDDSRH